MNTIVSHSPPSEKYQSCLEGKQTRVPFTLTDSTTSEVLELLHSDLHGPTTVQAMGGMSYFAVTIDDNFHNVFVHLLRNKRDHPARFKELKASIENITGRQIKHLRTDGGGEYSSNAFEVFFALRGDRAPKDRSQLFAE
ncbi:Retrovirus-related Pol polyprotein from transposon TNT 1-94 [Ceratobasidium sp. AG-Ba]|nr:Retrovirus-related Pol polyprotein from transposon TNT 1-94 [Ceratobasidium sp. AG-Ba]